MHILVRDNNVDRTLPILEEMLQREGVLREIRQREYYEKTLGQARQRKAEGVRRARKLARMKLDREMGIVTVKKRPAR